MVYGGKPSRGCQTCKNRKIKCDEGRPTCLQCQKSSRTCLGYKEEADYIFRNQTEKVTEKVTQKVQKARKPRSAGLPDSAIKTVARITKKGQASESCTTIRVEPQETFRAGDQLIPTLKNGQYNFMLASKPIPGPTTKIEDEVVQVYLRNFGRLYISQDTVRGFLPFLSPMYSASEDGSLLRTATQATALCAISQLPDLGHLRYKAASTYGSAMKAAAIALQDPANANSDETLQATLLLCLYESIRASDNSIDAWSNHVEGASAIVQSRGPQQLLDPQSLALFRATRTQMLINSIRKGKAPKQFPGGIGWLGDSYQDDALAHLTHCTMELPSLMDEGRAILQGERNVETMASMEALIERTRHLEGVMKDWFDSLTDEWRPHTVAYIRDKPVYPEYAEAWVGPVHAFTDVDKGSILNKLHSCHMLATMIILNGLEWLRPYDYPLDDRYIHSRYTEQCTIDDICSSVPYYLGIGKERARNPDQMETIADLIGGYSLIWPLHAAASCPRIEQDQRLYIYGRLTKIAQDCGLEQALLIDPEVKLKFLPDR